MKRKILLIIVMLICFMIVNVEQVGIIANDEFKGNEEEWLKTCSVAQETQEEVDTCIAFKEYYQQQQNELVYFKQ